MFGEAMDSADKATNKAMSAAYKYMATQEFCIPTEGDNDADLHTPEVVTRISVEATGAMTAITMADGRAALKAWKAENESVLASMSDADNDRVVQHYTDRWKAFAPASPPVQQLSRDEARRDAEEVFS